MNEKHQHERHRIIHQESELWKPRYVKLPEDWVIFAIRQQQAMVGSPGHRYILGVMYNADEVKEILHGWGLQWQTVLAGWLWESDLKTIRSSTLSELEEVIRLLQATDNYIQAIEEENLVELFAPPYVELDALLIAIAMYKSALQSLLLQTNQDRIREMRGKIERIGDTLLNITKRFGMWYIKREIEDLCFQVLDPEQFVHDKAEYEQLLRQDHVLLEWLHGLFVIYSENLSGRPVHITYTPCGIAGLRRRSQDAHTTVTTSKGQFTALDLVTFDILVPTVRICYEALGFFKLLGYVQDRVTDHVSHPKSNGYSYIAFRLNIDLDHPSVEYMKCMFPDNVKMIACQIQIGTLMMRAIMDYGCLYPPCYQLYKIQQKEEKLYFPSSHSFMDSEKGMTLYAIQKAIIQEQELWETERKRSENEGRASLIVYDQHGRSFLVPKGATAADFAYTVYPKSKSGWSHIEVIVNNRKAPLGRKLSLGDTIEVIVAHAARDTDVTTPQARRYITELPTSDVDGISLVQSYICDKYHHHLNRRIVIEELQQVVVRYQLHPLEEYLERLQEVQGKENVMNVAPVYTMPWLAIQVMQQITDRAYEVQEKYWWVPLESIAVHTHTFHLALCEQCLPKYPEKIIGVVHEKKEEITIHKLDCWYLNDEMGLHTAYTPVEWKMLPVFRVSLLIKAQDRRGLVNDITWQLRYYQCLLQVIYAEAYEIDIDAEIRLLIETHDVYEVKNIRETLLNVEGIKSVFWEPGTTPSRVYEQLERLINTRNVTIDKPVDDTQTALERRNLVLDNKFSISQPASDAMFFGHHTELEKIQRTLCQEERGGAVLIYGPRRSGKSSLGRVFLERNVRPPMWYVYCSLQGEQWEDAEHIWHNLADRLRHAFQQQLHTDAPGWDDYTETNPRMRFQALLEQYLEMNPSNRLVMVLDEFGDALDAFQKGILSASFFTFWRSLIQQANRVSLMIILPTNAYNILRTQALASVLDFALPIDVQFLDGENARRLLVDTLRQQQIVIDHAAAAYAYMITSGNPYFLQIIGMHLIMFLNNSRLEQYIHMQHMQGIIDEIVHSHSYNHFEFYRNEIQRKEEMDILRIIMEITYSHEKSQISLGELALRLKMSPLMLKRLLDRMVSGSLLKVSNVSHTDPYYGYKIELVRLWMINHQDFFTQSFLK